jgi:hypothetical protein
MLIIPGRAFLIATVNRIHGGLCNRVVVGHGITFLSFYRFSWAVSFMT